MTRAFVSATDSSGRRHTLNAYDSDSMGLARELVAEGHTRVQVRWLPSAPTVNLRKPEGQAIPAGLIEWATTAQHRGDGWHSEAARIVLSLSRGVADDPWFAVAALDRWAERSDRGYSREDRAAAALVWSVPSATLRNAAADRKPVA